MSTRRKVASLAFTGAATAAAFALRAGPALAVSGTWHIQAPKGMPYHGALRAKANGAGFVMVDESHPSFPITCTSAPAAGSIPHATVTGTTAITTIGEIKAANFNHCSFLGAVAKGSLTADLALTSYHASTGIADGKVAHVAMVWAGSGNSCHATMTGSLSAYYNNTTHHLVLDKAHKATLTIHSPTAGCFPPFGNGDKAYIAGTYNLTTPTSLFVSGPA